jgi:hypothetical protein
MEEVKPKSEGITSEAKDLFEHATDYLDTFYKLTVVNIVQKGVNIASGVINAVIVLFLGIFFLFFAGFGLAWWLGDALNSRAGGFFIVAGLGALAIVAILFMRKKKIFPFLRNLIIRKIYE